jgi:catechol O-methyltransferase
MELKPAVIFGSVFVVGIAAVMDALPLPRWAGVCMIAVGSTLLVHEFLGKPLPFLRWSMWQMGFKMRNVVERGQVGDGREKAVIAFLEANAPAGSPRAVLDAIDVYARQHKFLMNVGDEKGEILDAAVLRSRPTAALELGGYIGYSAIRIARRLPPKGHLYSVERSAENAALARRALRHAGLDGRVTVVVGSIGDGGTTLDVLQQQLRGGGFQFVFLDHNKDRYAEDLQTLLAHDLLDAGCTVLADNVGTFGAPEYRGYLERHEGRRWTTREHKTHMEYQSVITDAMLESTLHNP